MDASGAEPRVLDEPFVEAPLYVGGFWVIEAADETAAVEWATRASRALRTPIEVRALQGEPGS
ncbi:YciI family protein [Agromyces binzhouensis]|uniref:YciI family protein n=1 Tax=Agromyces binzhouensis TaxID=1817495 RepID=UPI003629BF6D